MAALDTSIKFWKWDMPNAPVWCSHNGADTPTDAMSVINLIKTVFVTGTAPVAVTSMDTSNGYAIVTMTNHGFTMFDETGIGPVVKIDGCNESYLNGEWRIVNVADANTFTLSIDSEVTESATGTITCSIPPLGWELAFEDTSTSTYYLVIRPDQEVYHKPFYQFKLDTTQRAAEITLYEDMTDYQTGTNSPDSPMYWYYTYSAYPQKKWWFVGDKESVNFGLDTYSANGWQAASLYLGRIEPFNPGDFYCNCLKFVYSGGSAGYVANWQPAAYNSSSMVQFTRDYSGIFSGTITTQTIVIGSTYTGYEVIASEDVDPISGTRYFFNLMFYNPGVGIRGKVRGVFDPFYRVPEDTFVRDDFTGRVFYYPPYYTTQRIAIEVLGPWA